MNDADRARIVAVLLTHYPTAQGIYLFGSQAAGTAWPGSHVDVALLLPAGEAERAGSLALGPAHVAFGRGVAPRRGFAQRPASEVLAFFT